MLTLCTAVAAHAFTISDIRVEGLQRTPLGTVLNYLPIQIGDEYNDDAGRQVIQSLYSTGFFDEVTLEKEGDTLIIAVDERPSIADIVITGNKAIKTDLINDQLRRAGLARGRIVSRELLQQISEELIAAYHAKSYYNVNVDVKEQSETRNRIALTITINEGEPAAIAAINIVGNTIYDEKTLLDEFQLGRTNLFSYFTKNDKYARQKLEADIEALKSFYQNRGYIDFRVTSTQVALSPDRKQVFITITVEEGDRYRFGQSSFANIYEDDVSVDELQPLITYKEGDVYNRRAVIDTVNAIVDLLGRRGYAFASVTPEPLIDAARGVVDMQLTVTPGARTYVNRIVINGNTRTHDRVIRREMLQFEGAMFNTASMRESVRRLNRTGYFDDVAIDFTRVDGRDDLVDINVTVRERLTGMYTFGVTYWDEIGLTFDVGVTEENLFGTGNKANVQVQYSKAVQRYLFRFTDPYFTADGQSVTYSLSYDQRNASELGDSNYQLDGASAGISYGIPLDDRRSMSFGISLDRRTLDCGGDFATDDINGERTQCAKYNVVNQATVDVGYTTDTLDRFIFPTSGNKRSLGMTVTAPFGDVNYYKLYSNNQWYFPIGADLTMRWHANLAYADGFANDPLPFYERYFTGGSGSIRGFQGNTLAPLYPNGDTKGGNFRVIGGLNVIFPPPFFADTENLRMGVFLDVGNVYADLSSVSVTDLRVSTGVSLGWFTPIGPLSLNFSQPLNKKSTDRTNSIQFTIGLPF